MKKKVLKYTIIYSNNNKCCVTKNNLITVTVKYYHKLIRKVKIYHYVCKMGLLKYKTISKHS